MMSCCILSISISTLSRSVSLSSSRPQEAKKATLSFPLIAMASSSPSTNGDSSPCNFQDANRDLDYDVLIIGAGMSGIYSLHRMRQLGLRTRVLEAASDVGGTWYWNRYPGARFDSESYSYNFSFSKEILDEWNWTEHFASQPETLRYIEFVVEKLNLRSDMQFDTRIKSMHFQDATRSWLLTDDNSKTYSCRYIVTCIGILSEPTLPDIPGVESYKGKACHTSRWPHEKVEFEGKRVAVIGTGATGIQTIQEVAKTVGHLTVFQRTPNWSVPMRNKDISPEEMDDIKKSYPEIFESCSESFVGFIHGACKDNRRTLDVPVEEREAFWESLYAAPGFAKWISNFRDQFTDKEANAVYSEFIANKVRQRVKDPVTAEKLIPKSHGFGTRRVPLETNYFEVYNQDNVRLISVIEDPIERITEKGIKTQSENMEFDMIIYATGFDAITGSFKAMDIRGIDGIQLSEQWSEGPKTYLGLFARGFPNMMTVMGPHQAFGNIPRSIEYAAGWVADFIKFVRDNIITYAEATPEGVQEWTQHVHKCAEGLLANEIDSWMTGVNKNLKWKQKRIIARYNGPAPGYRKRCNEVAARNYSDLKLLKPGGTDERTDQLPSKMFAWRKHKGSIIPVWEEVPVPKTPADGYLVKLLASGVCHSDDALLKIEKRPPHFHEKFILGHEGCGKIVKIGENAGDELKIGDEVALLAVPGCGKDTCPECSRDLAQLCQTGTHHGIGQDGFYAPYAAVSSRAVVPLPEGESNCICCFVVANYILGISPATAAVATDAVLTAYHGVTKRAEVKKDETVFLFGLGGLGFNALQIVHKAIGARLIVSDVREERLAEAAKMGVPREQIVPVGQSVQEWVQGNGFAGKIDTVLDFVGKNQTFEDAQQIGQYRKFLMSFRHLINYFSSSRW